MSIDGKHSGKENDTVLVERMDFQAVFPSWEMEFWNDLKDSLERLAAPALNGSRWSGVGVGRNETSLRRRGGG
jgi:hypothetical protein